MKAHLFSAEAYVTLRRIEARRRAASRASIPLTLSALPAMAAATALGSLPFLGLSMLLATLGQAALFASGREEGIPPITRRTAVTVDEDALTIGVGKRARRVTRSRVESAWATKAGDVVIRLQDGGEIAASFHLASDARALVAALGVDASEHAARFPIGRKARRITEELRRWLGDTASMPAACLWAASVFFPWIFAGGAASAMRSALVEPGAIPAKIAVVVASTIFSITGTVLMTLMMKRREVTVGSDGILVQGMLTSRFVPYASLDRVEGYENNGLRLHTKGGEVIHLPGAPGGEGLSARIRAALEKLDDAEDVPSARLADLDRRGMSREEWREELHRIARRGEGYRGTTLSPERLAAIVGDASIAADRRVGAALLLAAQGDEASKKRIRIAADACADEDMRAALEQAAEGEIADEPIERAARRLDP